MKYLLEKYYRFIFKKIGGEGIKEPETSQSVKLPILHTVFCAIAGKYLVES